MRNIFESFDKVLANIVKPVEADPELLELARRAAAANEKRNQTYTKKDWDEWAKRLAADLAGAGEYE